MMLLLMIMAVKNKRNIVSLFLLCLIFDAEKPQHDGLRPICIYNSQPSLGRARVK